MDLVHARLDGGSGRSLCQPETEPAGALRFAQTPAEVTCPACRAHPCGPSPDRPSPCPGLDRHARAERFGGATLCEPELQPVITPLYGHSARDVTCDRCRRELIRLDALRPCGPPASPEEHFLHRLRTAEGAALTMRDRALELLQSVPTDPGAVNDPEAAERLGALVLLTGKNTEWISNATSLIVTMFASTTTQAMFDAFGEHFADGQTRVEMTCECGKCNACQARENLGEEQARENIRAVLSPKRTQGPALVDRAGRPIRKA